LYFAELPIKCEKPFLLLFFRLTCGLAAVPVTFTVTSKWQPQQRVWFWITMKNGSKASAEVPSDNDGVGPPIPEKGLSERMG